ncbi:MAG: hypothetical protein JW909_08490 [Planctomycetes bacterium]|nr:hypothetical protein [Planctomycetota bacterium]
MAAGKFGGVIRLAAGLFFAAGILVSCGGESPVVVWLARHGHEVPAAMAADIAKGRVTVGMPEEAVDAIIVTLGCRIIERRDMGDAMTRLVYRLVNQDTAGRTHSARAIVLIRDGIVVAVDLVPEN